MKKKPKRKKKTGSRRKVLTEKEQKEVQEMFRESLTFD